MTIGSILREYSSFIPEEARKKIDDKAFVVFSFVIGNMAFCTRDVVIHSWNLLTVAPLRNDGDPMGLLREVSSLVQIPGEFLSSELESFLEFFLRWEEVPRTLSQKKIEHLFLFVVKNPISAIILLAERVAIVITLYPFWKDSGESTEERSFNFVCAIIWIPSVPLELLAYEIDAIVNFLFDEQDPSKNDPASPQSKSSSPNLPKTRSINQNPTAGAQKRSTSAVNGVGLPNTGNTCWLNSAMQFLADSKLFDLILDQDSSKFSNNDKQLFESIKSVVGKLQQRTVVTSQDMCQLQNYYHQKVGRRLGIGQQLDSTEFLSQLLAWFDDDKLTIIPENQLIQSVTYIPGEENKFKEIKKSVSSLILMDRLGFVQERDKGKIFEIEQLLFQPSVTAFHIEPEDFTDAPKEEIKDENGDWIMHDRLENVYITQIPDKFCIQMAIYSEQPNVYQGKANQQRELRRRYNYAIQVEENGFIYLHEYAFDESSKSYKRQYQVKCQINGAIMHGGSANGGHYTYMKREKNGSYTEYSDSSVRENAQFIVNSSIKDATHLYLEVVEGLPLNSSKDNPEVIDLPISKSELNVVRRVKSLPNMQLGVSVKEVRSITPV